MKKRVLLALAALVMTTLSFAQEYMIIENTSGQKARIDVSIIKQVYFETVEQPTPVDPKGTGTLEDPFNVSAAIVKCQELGETPSEETYYIKGIIATIKEEFGAQFGNAYFTISDDGSAANLFTCYRVLFLGNQKWVEGNTQIKVGDEVIICGALVNYRGTTPETAINTAYIYSLNGQTEAGEPSIAPGSTIDNPMTVTQAIAAASALDANVPTENDFYTKGKIAKIRYTYSAQYGTATYYISDDGTENNTFLVYGSYFFGNESWQEGQTQIQVGDEVIDCGKLINYNGTTPEYADKKNWLVSLNGKTSEGGEVTPPTEEIKTATVAEFNAAAESTTVWYKLTGTVKNLKDGDNYGNFDLEDETGSVYVYGLLATKGGEKKKFQDLVTAKGIANDKKITIIGNRGSYNGKIEVLNAYFDSIE